MTRAILVTGASSGICRATAELFLAEGWKVGLLARRRDPLDDMDAQHAGAVVLKAELMPTMDVARSVLHVASLPLEANVQFMTVVATKMPYIDRG